MQRRLLHGIAIGTVAAALALLLDQTGIGLDSIERLSWDWRVRQLGEPSEQTDQIRLVLIDQSSLDWAETKFSVPWKWPRQFYVPVLQYLQEAGAKAVAFDMLFTESSDALDPTDDAQFGRAISNGPPFIAVLSLSETQGRTTNWPVHLPPPPAIRVVDGAAQLDLDARIRQLPRSSPPIAAVASGAYGVGNVFAMPDSDGIYRRIAPLVTFDGRPVPTLGLSLYLAGNTNDLLSLSPQGLGVGGATIPLDRQGQAVLRYRGRSQTHQAVNAAAVIESQLLMQAGEPPLIPLDFFKDRYVLFGVSAPALHDMKPTPVSGSLPGVEIHATLLDNLLANDFARPLPLLPHLLLVLLLGLGAGITTRMSTHIWQPLVLLLAAPACAVGVALAGYSATYWVPLASPAAAGILAVIGGVVVNYALEGRQKRFIKHAFKQYLSPDVIDALMRDPAGLTLGGEARELTIFFSDLQGFTGISEGLDPQSLTALLNEYLTAMTDIILESGGTIDKYEGDAIIAFWNAPLPTADHVQQGVQAALDCQDKLAELRPALLAKYGAELHVRIGLNTGTVVVGNLGSTRRFDYTFLGDAGNLASRLEGINKQFGTGILISEATATAVAPAPSLHLRQIGRVKVVGRQEPVTVYEPRPAPQHGDTAFATALQAYYSGDFDKAHGFFAALAGEDVVASRYVPHCAQLQARPPETWDGIWIMDQK